MLELVYLSVGVVVGGALGWYVTLNRQKAISASQKAELQALLAKAETQVGQLQETLSNTDRELKDLQSRYSMLLQEHARLKEAEQGLSRELEFIKNAHQTMSEQFKALSHDALLQNTAEFRKYVDDLMKQIDLRVNAQTAEGKLELQSKKQLIDQSLEGMHKTLLEIQKRIENIAYSSGERISEVTALLKTHSQITTRLTEASEALNKALSGTKTRGQWGERMAEDIIRLAGLVENINYRKQKTLDASTRRPDFTFLLPDGLSVNMDVKFPMDNFIKLINAETEAEKKHFADELIRNVKAMIKQVASRDYINPASNTLNYAILFIPSEQIFACLHSIAPEIFDEAIKNRVILCSPYSLYAVLAVIHQASVNFNIQKQTDLIISSFREFYKQWQNYKLSFQSLAKAIENVQKEYDKLVSTRTNMLEKPLKKIALIASKNDDDQNSGLKIGSLLEQDE